MKQQTNKPTNPVVEPALDKQRLLRLPSLTKLLRLTSAVAVSLVLSVLSLVPMLSSTASAAGSATLTLGPSSDTFEKGDTFKLTIYENSGSEQVNSIQANLKYDTAKLKFVSIDSSTSAFAIEAEANGGGGNVKIARGSLTQRTGKQIVSKVTFKALTASGSSKITFATDSAIVRGSDTQDIWNGYTTGGTYSFKAAPSTNTDTNNDTSNDTNNDSSNDINDDDNDAPKKTPSKPKSDDEPVPVKPASGITNYLVAIKVLGATTGTEVKLDEQTATTDQNGIAGFTDVSSGEHQVSALGTTKTITVEDNGNNTNVQQFELAPTATAKSKYITYGLIGLSIVVLLIAASSLSRYIKHRKELNRHFASASVSSAVTSAPAEPIAPVQPVTPIAPPTNAPTTTTPQVIQPTEDQSESKV